MSKSTQETPKTKEYFFSDDRAGKALAEHVYVKANDPQLSGTLSIKGSTNMWKNGNDDFIYFPELRLAGTKSDIINLLKKSGMITADNTATVEKLLDGAYTKSNVKNNKAIEERLTKEIELYNSYKNVNKKKKTEKTKNWTYNIASLTSINEELKNLIPEGSKVIEKKVGGKNKITLKDQFKTLPAGYIINVTNFINNGYKGKIVPEITPGTKTKLHRIPGFNIVSENIPSFEEAMNHLGPEYIPYSVQFRDILNKNINKYVNNKSTDSSSSNIPSIPTPSNTPLMTMNNTMSLPSTPLPSLPSIPNKK